MPIRKPPITVAAIFAGVIFFAFGALLHAQQRENASRAADGKSDPAVDKALPNSPNVKSDVPNETPATNEKPDANADTADKLAQDEQHIAEKYKHLEEIMLQMAELGAQSDPQRAALLKKVLTQSKDQLITARIERLVEFLQKDQLSPAIENQTQLDQDLRGLLEMLLSENRAKRIQSEKTRIREYLKRLGNILKQEKDVQGRTTDRDDAKLLAELQGKIAERTGGLSKDIQSNEEGGRQNSQNPADKSPSDTDKERGQNQGKNDQGKNDQGKGDQGKNDQGKNNQGKNDQGKSDQGKSDKGKNDQGKSDQGKSDKGKNDQGKNDQGKSDQGKNDKGKNDQGKNDQAKNNQGKNDQGKNDQEKNDQDDNQARNDENDRSNADQQANPARKRLDAAQKRMESARKNLEKAQHEGAAKDQEEAVKELEQAKAELEQILRQLREEEVERMLAMLESRFRKMLDMQRDVYDGTVRLDKIPTEERTHNHEIDSGRLGAKEMQIVLEVDKALLMLREDGTTAAFAEAADQMRTDMQQIVDRLSQAKVGQVTQGIELDVVATLEEMIDALKKAQKDLERNRNQNQNQRQNQNNRNQQNERPELSLVDKLAEIKMIRALQMRINTRTERYSKLVEGEQAQDADLIDALKRLAERQDRVYRVTHDLSSGKTE